MRSIFSFTFRAAPMTAPPPATTLRLPQVPQPYGVAWVSPCVNEMSPTSTPSSSATICAYVVWWPCPCENVPTLSATPPAGSMRIVAES